MTSGSPCILDSDCNGTFLCYSELPWLEEEDSSCLCNTFYGWEGESCENLGSVSYFQIISITVQLVIIAVLLCLLVPLTRRLGAYLKRCCDSSFRTYLSWVFGIVCLCIWKICSLIVIVSPEQLTRTVELNSREETVNPITVIVEFPAAVATIIFAILCFINVTILWLETVISLGTYGRRSQLNCRQMLRLRLYFHALQVFGLIAIIVVARTEAAVLIAFSLCVLGFQLTMFLIAYYQIKKILHFNLKNMTSRVAASRQRSEEKPLVASKLSPQEASILFILGIIKRTAHGVIASVLFLVLCGILYYIFSNSNGGWRFYSPAGSLSFYMIVYEGQAWGLLLFYLVIFNFLWKSYSGIQSGKSLRNKRNEVVGSTTVPPYSQLPASMQLPRGFQQARRPPKSPFGGQFTIPSTLEFQSASRFGMEDGMVDPVPSSEITFRNSEL